ncbi:MAG: T9SS type A sorting domain-containing protein [Bacteroidota bacterium]
MKNIFTMFFATMLVLGAVSNLGAQQVLDPSNYYTVDNSPNSPTSPASDPGSTTISPEYNEVGLWWTGASASGFGGGYRQTSQLGGIPIAGRSATWTVTVPPEKSDIYIIYNYVLQAANNASNVFYKLQYEFSNIVQDSVRHDLRRSTITVATVGVGSWVPLMIDTLNSGNYKITVGGDSLSGSAIMRADGIRILRSSSTGADLEFGRRTRNGFDSVRVGEVWTDSPLGVITYKQIPLFNLGSTTLVVTNVYATNLPNRWDIKLPDNAAFPLNIPPGGKANVAVGFRPFQEENIIDTLVIESNDSLEMKARIPLSGNGINYNFILNASMTNEPNYNAPFDNLGNPNRPEIVRTGTWAPSGTGISAFPFQIAGGNLQGTFSFDAVASTEYRFKLPDSVNGQPGSSGNYFIEFGAIPFSSNTDNAQIEIIPAFSVDTVRSSYNASEAIIPPFFYPLANKPIFLNQGDWTKVKIFREVALNAVLRADLLRIRKIPTGATLAATPQLNFGNVSIYESVRNLAKNFRLDIEINSGGESALRIDSVVILNPRFYKFVDKPQFPILLAAVNGSEKLTVEFLPDTIAGTLSTTARVYSNDSTKSPYSILLTGAGVGTGVVVEENDVEAAYTFPQNPVIFPDFANMNKWQVSTTGGSGGATMLGYIYNLNGDPALPNKASYVEYFPKIPVLDGGSPGLDTFNVYARVPVGSSNSSPRVIYKVFQGAGKEVQIDTINQNNRGADRVFLGRSVFLRSNSRDAHGTGAINGYIRLENDTALVSEYYKDSLVNRARKDSFVVRADAIILQEATLVVGVEYEVLPDVPNTYSLSQNYPNPFNPTTKIQFGVPMTGNVELRIYDVLGREVRRLVNEQYDAGMYSVQWDGKNSLGKQVSTGMYIYQIRAGQFVQTKKMLLLK